MTADGTRYRGHFEKGCQSGNGVEITPSGDKYEGSFAGGLRHGRGTCEYASGDRYEGRWERGARHGRGTCVFASREVFRGTWESDAWVQEGACGEKSEAFGPGLAKAVAGEDAVFGVQVMGGWVGESRGARSDAVAGGGSAHTFFSFLSHLLLTSC